MATTLSPDLVQRVTETPMSKGVDTEKDLVFTHAGEASSTEHGSKHESETDSAEFQGGVQRVRAITATWSTKSLVIMFVL